MPTITIELIEKDYARLLKKVIATRRKSPETYLKALILGELLRDMVAVAEGDAHGGD